VTQGTTGCTEQQWTAPSTNLLVAQPGGKPPVDFKLTSDSASELVFVNPGHAGRLKSLIYRREADGNLTARVELEEAGSAWHNAHTYAPAALFPVRCTK
jgi:hypothetical protein